MVNEFPVSQRNFEIWITYKVGGYKQKDVAAKYGISRRRVSAIVMRVQHLLDTNKLNGLGLALWLNALPMNVT